MHNIRITLISLLCLTTFVVQAETVYVIDELKIGLHESASISSPISKLISSGTALTVIERSKELVHVEESEGVRGWINNKYIVTDKPGKARVNELEKEIELLKSSTMMTNDVTDGQKELAQQLNSERLKSGGLQVELADLKARIANIDNSDQFLADIDQLKQENQQLRSQLESTGVDIQAETGSINNVVSLYGWEQLLTALIIALVIGIAVGIFILDHLNRRRHGGFRI